ncbi:Small ubiquitin-related modifier 1 [Strongyloides ratti]|uniref:Small ubiquitin-related modifier n=1 Tax=Strongyloides ratti TaxID=34506 RepID=A0A090LMK6_STRRB|nr:Small ubiquitin-related modifier 1 [Strongyloides ratti]CEF68765.1 Small ubiquitin-related modifier 1 [Strongyloides ratti]
MSDNDKTPDNSVGNNTASSTAGENEDDFIRLRVMGQASNEVHFKVKKTTTMSKLKKTYADRMGVSPNSLRFLFDGKRIENTDTPKSLEMDQDDVIEVYTEQVGGFC